MSRLFRSLFQVVALLLLFVPPSHAADGFRVPILLYHRFGATVADGMTIKTPVFEAQMKYLHDNGYKGIPLRRLVDYYLGKAPAPAPKSVVIVEDDAPIRRFVRTTLVAEPTTQASAISVGTVNQTSLANVTWTDGNGRKNVIPSTPILNPSSRIMSTVSLRVPSTDPRATTITSASLVRY